MQTENYELNGKSKAARSVSCSRKQAGSITISIVNVPPHKNMPLECELPGAQPAAVAARILTAAQLNSHNTFVQPGNVKIAAIKQAAVDDGVLKIEVPARSVVVSHVN